MKLIRIVQHPDACQCGADHGEWCWYCCKAGMPAGFELDLYDMNFEPVKLDCFPRLEE